jgi:hypothetical protein
VVQNGGDENSMVVTEQNREHGTVTYQQEQQMQNERVASDASLMMVARPKALYTFAQV